MQGRRKKKLIVLIDEDKFEVSAKKEENRWSFKINDNEFKVDVARLKEGTFSLIINGKSVEAEVEQTSENGFYIHLSNQSTQLSIFDREIFMARKSISIERKVEEKILTSPMPGKIVKILVKEEETVKKHQAVLTMEAMKMENEIRSPIDGIVKKIYIKEGDVIEGNVNLVLISGA